jgi:hypothetical protein
MTVTKLYLIDSRLKAQRSVEVQVQFYRIWNERRERDPSLVRFIALSADYISADPIEVELSDGTWSLDFVSYAGNQVGCTICVPSPNNVQRIDAAVLEGVISPTMPKPMSYGQFVEREEFNEKLPRRFVPSRASASFIALDNLRASQSRLANKLKIEAKVIEFCGRSTGPNKREALQFSTGESFEHRLDCWLQNWRPVHDNTEVVVEVETTPGKELHTGRFQVFTGDGHHRKTILSIIFPDERYVLLIPHMGPRTGKKARWIDIEIDFFDVPQTSANPRISQVRVLTDNSAFNGVIQLLSTGHLYSASTLWKRNAQQVLRDKFTDPIAAVAGALTLAQPEIAFTLENENIEQIWEWLNNLNSHFGWISEGPICLAWMLGAVSNAGLVRVGSNEELKARIGRLMIEAISRGVPLYSEGLNLLSKAVDWASSEIDEELRAAVHWLAVHSVNAGPFLLLRDQLR